MKGIWDHISARGVKSILGERAEKVVKLKYSNGKATGVTTAVGRTHNAALIISALDAAGAAVLPQIGTSSAARSWPVAHIKPTEDECNLLRGIPTTNIRDLGFLFEPYPKTKLFKPCPLGIG
jgi:sarcosine oxidase/L-pipecolate oxidase